jgi:hypothetical protein
MDVRISMKKTVKLRDACREEGATNATEKNALSMIRNIMLAITETNGRIGREVRQAFDLDGTMLCAVQTLSNEESRCLVAEDDGQWMKNLDETIKKTRCFCIFDKLVQVKCFLLRAQQSQGAFLID